MHCDGVLTRLQVEIVAPVAGRTADLLARAVSRPALAAAVVVGALAGVAALPLPIIDLTMTALAAVALAGTYFNAVDHVARGKAGFPAPAEADGWAERTLAVRGLLCLLVAVVPFGLWLAVNPGAESTAELAAARPVTAALLIALSQAWLAAALLAVLASVSGLAAFWPPALVVVIQRAPGRYLQLLALMAGTSLVAAAVVLVAARTTAGVPVLSAFVAATLASVAAFAQATLVGGFVHRHRELYAVR
jgi:hypothetical protein